MCLLKLLIKAILLPVMLVLLVLQMLIKIGVELSSVIIGGLMLIMIGCIIYTVSKQMWSSMAVLIAMEICLVLICFSAGLLEGILDIVIERICRL